MTVKEIAERCGFAVACGGDGLERAVTGVFCCDLLSWAMGRAPADSAWITVMGNVNAGAVAVLADTACLVLAEDAVMDDAGLQKAQAQGVAVLRTALPSFDAGLAVHTALAAEGV